MSTYSMHCASARHRLQVGISATIEHRQRHRDSSTAVSVAECVHHYIGTMDTLKLNMAAKDQIAPCLSDLSVSLYKVPQLPAESMKTLCSALMERRKRCASDELSEHEVRQLLFDMENSYTIHAASWWTSRSGDSCSRHTGTTKLILTSL